MPNATLKLWSGRRGSNPRPTAWKAVTLPLSYSRQFLTSESRSRIPGKLVAREGLEPSKPLGRQIYSLLRLTASLPRQLSVLECVRSALTLRALLNSAAPLTESRRDGAGEGIRTPDLLITNQLLYRTELPQPDKRGTLARPVPPCNPCAIPYYC